MTKKVTKKKKKSDLTILKPTNNIRKITKQELHIYNAKIPKH